MEIKAFKFELTKDIGDSGEFEGYLNTWGLDLGEDDIKPGAFKRTIGAWASKGRPLPMLFMHYSSEPIGCYPVLSEDSKGLAVKGQLALDVQRAREAYALMKMRVLAEQSIGYDIPDGGFAYRADGGRDITEVKLYEGSPVVWAMNDRATIDNVKGLHDIIHELKTGRMLSSRNREMVANALSALQALLEAADASQSSDDGSDDGKSGHETPGASATPALVQADWIHEFRSQLH